MNMNRIDNSHIEAVLNWVEDNPEHEFRVKRMPQAELPWQIMLINTTDDTGEPTHWAGGKTFSTAIAAVSRWVREQIPDFK